MGQESVVGGVSWDSEEVKPKYRKEKNGLQVPEGLGCQWEAVSSDVEGGSFFSLLPLFPPSSRADHPQGPEAGTTLSLGGHLTSVLHGFQT